MRDGHGRGADASGGSPAATRQLAGIDSVGPQNRHVYVSPHFDDVALSAGATALLQRARGEPLLVVSVFTAPPTGALSGFAEFQHGRWGGAADPWQEREAEERAAMGELGADHLWLGYADAIYRGDQYVSDADLFGPAKPADADLGRALAADLVAVWQRCPRATFYLPLGVGRHVDHQLCAEAAADLRGAGAAIAWYEDYPYAMEPGAVAPRVAALLGSAEPFVVEVGEAIEAKVRLVELYRSQVPWIFRSYGRAGDALRRHAASLSRTPAGFAERFWPDSARGAQ